MGEPQGVRVRREDDTLIDCELIHLGPDKSGRDLWEVTGVLFHPGRDKLEIDVLPSRTGISITSSGPWQDEDCADRPYYEQPLRRSRLRSFFGFLAGRNELR